MNRILTFIYGKRYNVVHAISGGIAFGWFVYLHQHPGSLKIIVRDGFDIISQRHHAWLVLVVALMHLAAMCSHKAWIGKTALVLGTFMWGVVTATFILGPLPYIGVVTYGVLTLACFFTALDMSFVKHRGD
jgi:K+-sensing histidine kinase KdpD